MVDSQVQTIKNFCRMHSIEVDTDDNESLLHCIDAALDCIDSRRLPGGGQPVHTSGSARINSLEKTKLMLADELAVKTETRFSLQQSVQDQKTQIEVLERKMQAARLLKDASRQLLEINRTA
jgi:hypothetical protein